MDRPHCSTKTNFGVSASVAWSWVIRTSATWIEGLKNPGSVTCPQRIPDFFGKRSRWLPEEGRGWLYAFSCGFPTYTGWGSSCLRPTAAAGCAGASHFAACCIRHGRGGRRPCPDAMRPHLMRPRPMSSHHPRQRPAAWPARRRRSACPCEWVRRRSGAIGQARCRQCGKIGSTGPR